MDITVCQNPYGTFYAYVRSVVYHSNDLTSTNFNNSLNVYMITMDVQSITQYIMSGEETKKHVIDYMVIKEAHRKQKRKVAQSKYRKSEKGKLVARRTYLKNYMPTGKPRGRPIKILT